MKSILEEWKVFESVYEIYSLDFVSRTGILLVDNKFKHSFLWNNNERPTVKTALKYLRQFNDI